MHGRQLAQNSRTGNSPKQCARIHTDVPSGALPVCCGNVFWEPFFGQMAGKNLNEHASPRRTCRSALSQAGNVTESYLIAGIEMSHIVSNTNLYLLKIT